MAAALVSRPLADLEMESVLAVEAAWQRRAGGRKPQTIAEFLNAVDTVHVRYALRREWLRRHPQGVSS